MQQWKSWNPFQNIEIVWDNQVGFQNHQLHTYEHLETKHNFFKHSLQGQFKPTIKLKYSIKPNNKWVTHNECVNCNKKWTVIYELKVINRPSVSII